MGSGSFGPGSTWPGDTGDGDATWAAQDYQPTRPSFSGPAYQPTEVARPVPTAPASPAPAPPAEVVRYGPGVPPTPPPNQAGLTAEQVWRTGRPARAHRRPAGWRRPAGSALTVALLAASAIVLFLRFHHAPLHVTRVAVARSAASGCNVDVTGHISTNGSAGTVSYQWVFRPDPRPPQPLSQSVIAGQHDVYVTVAVQGQGQGAASQTVTLRVLGPDRGAASTSVVVSC